VPLILLQAGGAARVLRHDPTRAETALAQVEVLGQEAIVELRRMLALLRLDTDTAGPSSSPRGLDMLGDLVAQVRTQGVDVDLGVDGERRGLAPGVDVSAYRIVQEALTNATRYGNRPDGIQVRVDWLAAGLRLTVRNRIAPDPPARTPSGGYGLLGLRERAHAAGGQVEAGPQDDGTFLVRATLPVTPAREPATPGPSTHELTHEPSTHGARS
jgi:signal transduction histidine kinase